MKEIINDWCQFCEGIKAYDKSHFYTLFWEEEISTNDLYQIFKYFPNHNELIKIMTNYLHGNQEITNKSNDFIMQLVQKDIQEKVSLSNNLKYIIDYPIEFIEDYSFVSNKVGSDEYYEYYDEISDIISDKWILEDKKSFALYEAFYGLTKNYEIVWYLFSPLLKTPINYKYYFDISISGGIYTIYNKKILVSREI